MHCQDQQPQDHHHGISASQQSLIRRTNQSWLQTTKAHRNDICGSHSRKTNQASPDSHNIKKIWYVITVLSLQKVYDNV
jgi:hypothetical protein